MRFLPLPLRAPLLIALLLASSTSAAPPADRLELTTRLKRLVRSGDFEATPKAFRIIALSHLADGCAARGIEDAATRELATKCVSRALELARSVQPSKKAPQDEPQGLWLSHFNLILGAADQLGSCPDAEIHEAVSRTLARRSAKAPHLHAASYPGRAQRWPADQAVTLSSLARFDRAHGTELAAPLTGRWLAWLDAHATDKKSGLPFSEVTGKGKGARHPRGSAQAFLCRYLAEIDPARARVWWGAHKALLLVEVGPVIGFREWPPGVSHEADVDSGPIIRGIGTAASALAIGAARAVGDDELAARLEASAALAERLLDSSAAASTLAEAIRYQSAWKPRPAK